MLARRRRAGERLPSSASTSTASRRSTTCSATAPATFSCCEIGRPARAPPRGGAYLARLGGDEFALVAAGPQPARPRPSPRASGDRCRDIRCRRARSPDRTERRASRSIPQDGPDAATLLVNADAALYRAKADGRGAIRFFEADMDKRLRERRALQHDLRLGDRARRADAPLPAAGAHRRARSSGSRRWLRWRHPARGMVPPAVFIPLAEESGLIISIGEWVLREACREAASWPRPLQVAVNLSPVQFRHGDLPALVQYGSAGDRPSAATPRARSDRGRPDRRLQRGP